MQNHNNYEMNRNNGYGVGLYRDKRKGKFSGVCAGLANHFGVSPFVIRIAFVGAAFATNGVAVWVYIIAIFALAQQPSRPSQTMDFEYDEDERRYRKKNMFRYRDSAGVRIRRAKSRLNKLSARVEGMEQYVTSRRFELDKQFSKL